MRSILPVAAAAMLFVAPSESLAQCCGAPAVAPTVAYSPVVAAPAPAPLVQTTVVRDGWYPGKYLGRFTRNLFGWDRTTTYTAGYAPYTAAYAPAYTAGYSPYVAGYNPGYQVAYRPTYPATFGPVAYSAGYAPLAVTQSVSRPVVLSPVVSAPAACGGCSVGCDACSSCGVVEQAGYAVAPSTGCSSCQPAASYPVQPATVYGDSGSSGVIQEPRPALAPGENPPAERSIQTQRPQVDDSFDDAFGDEGFGEEPTSDTGASSDYWGAPPLFKPPANRVTRRGHPAPVRTAVYRRPATAAATAYEADAPAPQRRLSASGWASAAE